MSNPDGFWLERSKYLDELNEPWYSIMYRNWFGGFWNKYWLICILALSSYLYFQWAELDKTSVLLLSYWLGYVVRMWADTE